MAIIMEILMNKKILMKRKYVSAGVLISVAAFQQNKNNK